MRIRRRIIDFARGDDLHYFWRLYRLQKRAGQDGIVHDILTFLLSRCAHRHGGYIGPDTVPKRGCVPPPRPDGVFFSRSFPERGSLFLTNPRPPGPD